MDTHGVFDGLRVIDLTNGFAGGLATMILADNGASVVRVVPAELEAEDFSLLSAGGTQWHRGKDRVVVDFADDAQREDCRERLRSADIVVESYGQDRVGAWGLGFDDARSLNANVCYFSIDGFGRHPEFRSLPAHEGLVQAAAGRMADFGNTVGLGR